MTDDLLVTNHPVHPVHRIINPLLKGWLGSLALLVDGKILATAHPAQYGSSEKAYDYLIDQRNGWVNNYPDKYVDRKFEIVPLIN